MQGFLANASRLVFSACRRNNRNSKSSARAMKENTVSIEIDLPRYRVIALFDSPENLFKWQTGLQSFERLSGEPGHPGGKSKLVFLLPIREPAEERGTGTFCSQGTAK